MILIIVPKFNWWWITILPGKTEQFSFVFIHNLVDYYSSQDDMVFVYEQVQPFNFIKATQLRYNRIYNGNLEMVCHFYSPL